MSMKRFLALAAAAVIAVASTPALAKSKKKHRLHHGYYAGAYAPTGYWAGIQAPIAGGGWARGNDPSIGHPSAAGLSRSSGRCVEDLGYGRFKYCGW
jgi:hypothetical protein